METLVLFAKPPELGKVKTRLASRLGDGAALQLYRSFLHDTIALTERWRRTKVAADYNRRVVLYASKEDPFFDDLAETIEQRYGDCIDRVEVSIPLTNESDARILAAVVSQLAGTK